jgi:c(7)-type cytochrome triheme protein
MRCLAGVAALLALVLVSACEVYSRSLPTPGEYGKVILKDSSGDQIASVRFDHWLHRAFYTCRLCHVDIGFAMEANGTEVGPEANAKGLYCGACHNGSRLHNGKRIFRSCAVGIQPEERAECSRCHRSTAPGGGELTYSSFAKGLPKYQATGLVDWEEAESRGFVRPIDLLPGVSVRRPAMASQKDFSIVSRNSWMPDIIFSHEKHAGWNGCEVCHPDVFPSVKRGAFKYSMFQISEGLYCGLCHDRVAFPLLLCERCHAKPMRR